MQRNVDSARSASVLLDSVDFAAVAVLALLHLLHDLLRGAPLAPAERAGSGSAAEAARRLRFWCRLICVCVCRCSVACGLLLAEFCAALSAGGSSAQSGAECPVPDRQPSECCSRSHREAEKARRGRVQGRRCRRFAGRHAVCTQTFYFGAGFGRNIFQNLGQAGIGRD